MGQNAWLIYPVAYILSAVKSGFLLIGVKLKFLAYTQCGDCSDKAALIPQPGKHLSVTPVHGTMQ